MDRSSGTPGSGQSVVGRSLERLDGRDKVSGKAVYVDDLSLPGMLFARVVRSPHARALIKGIDAMTARTLRGVVAVLTAADIPGENCCSGFGDQPLLAADEVRFAGEAVALVVADSPSTAAEAARTVEVRYEVLPACLDPEESLAEGAPIVHEGGNLCCDRRTRRGSFATALAEADVVVTNTYRVPTVDHAFLEPHGAMAAPAPGGLTLWTSTKMIDWVAGPIARSLDLAPGRIRIIAPTVGGSFGGKPDSPCVGLAALAAYRLSRPVKLVYSREETMRASEKRHACVITCTHAADRTGRLLGVKVDSLCNAGAYMSASLGVTGKQIVHGAGPYYVPHVDLRARAAYTNLPVTGAMRGYGVPQSAFAHEIQMDILAEKLGMDPLELRLRNVLRPGQTTVNGQEVPEGTGAEACLLRLGEMLRQKNHELTAEEDDDHSSAWGIAFTFYGNGAGGRDTGRCRLRKETDGTYTLFLGVPDIGQGSTTILAQIACEELGISLEDLRVVTADTAETPSTGPAAATRVTVIVGRAVQAACRDLREKEKQVAASVVSDAASDGAPPQAGPLEVVSEFQGDGTPLDGNGQGAPYITYSYTAQAARVIVDTVTGQVSVDQALAVYDTGRVINPALYEGQSEGGFTGGLGYALFEEITLSDGRVENPNLHTYLIPTMLDAPPVETRTVPSSDGRGPYAAKGIGEPSIIPTAPAIANAVSRATGLRFTAIPITPEKICRGLKDK